MSESIAARLGLALGLTEPARDGRRFRAAELRAGLLSFLEGLSRSGPVVMVFDDLHEAHASLLDVIDELLQGARRLPVMVVAVARDSLLERRPGWGSHPDAVALRLEPLPEDDARELARVAGDPIDEATAGRIAAHAGGNPFFIVETTGMMLDEHPEHLQNAPHSHLLPPAGGPLLFQGWRAIISGGSLYWRFQTNLPRPGPQQRARASGRNRRRAQSHAQRPL